jgi:hypothetical protein
MGLTGHGARAEGQRSRSIIRRGPDPASILNNEVSRVGAAHGRM